jgi:hypothetical protein
MDSGIAPHSGASVFETMCFRARRAILSARIGMILIFVCIAGTCSATPITIVSATGTITNITDVFNIQNKVDEDFTLTVTGGQGLAYFVPFFFAQGENTDLGFGNQIATASVSWQSGGSGGGFSVPDFLGTPSNGCVVGSCAWIPFTFDVAQNFHITASATVAYQAFGNNNPRAQFEQGVLNASVILNSLGAFTALRGSGITLPGVTYTLDPVIGGISDQTGAPEPGSVMLVLAGLLLLPLRQHQWGIRMQRR